MSVYKGTPRAIWAKRIGAGVLAAVLAGVVWVTFGINDEVDARLSWVMVTLAFLVAATEGGLIFMQRGGHDV